MVLHDDPQHGVALYADQLTGAIGLPGLGILLDRLGDLPAGTPLHLHFTDRLWADSPEAAAERIVGLAGRHPFTVTLHDLPQPSDGERNLPRRSACYRAVARAAGRVVCNSAHEAALLREYTDSGVDAVVIPLPVQRQPSGAIEAPDGSVGVLGFFYPGKGHDEALAAMADAGATTMSILGRASPGHEQELDAFVARAATVGVHVEVSGHVDDAELVRRSRRVSVPVVAHRHVSASGSLGSWISAGRRPIATANRYTTEMAALRPRTLTIADPDELGAAIAAAFADPATTWLPSDLDVPLGRAEVAAAYVAAWEGVQW
ncbi:glycosyltransferase [Microbacterium sp. P03]|uniref:glycosyltransferase n=1 Tax=Microbacterium sp. P03 TaxID=3366946 RepID=UPI00374674DE